MAKKKIVFAAGYPLASFPFTTDKEHCPRCGASDISLVGNGKFTSGQAIGVCKVCGANYIVNPPGTPTPLTVVR